MNDLLHRLNWFAFDCRLWIGEKLDGARWWVIDAWCRAFDHRWDYLSTDGYRPGYASKSCRRCGRIGG